MGSAALKTMSKRPKLALEIDVEAGNELEESSFDLLSRINSMSLMGTPRQNAPSSPEFDETFFDEFAEVDGILDGGGDAESKRSASPMDPTFLDEFAELENLLEDGTVDAISGLEKGEVLLGASAAAEVLPNFAMKGVGGSRSRDGKN